MLYKYVFFCLTNQQLCDIELVVGAVSVYAHRVVLAAASAYFHVMFNSEYLSP